VNEQGLGKLQRKALEFARNNPGWQSYANDVERTVRRLAERGLVLLAPISRQFRAIMPMRCDACQAATINGKFCHETGCPNAKKTWVPERAEWIRFVECRECGSEVEAGEVCGCSDV
jgi:hypothetical protein